MAEESRSPASYIGRHADHYDLIYAQKNYRDEAAFVHQLLQQHGARVGALLELACGTGSHALEFARLGYQVTATDYSEDMLRVARDKAARHAAAVQFHRIDMRELGDRQWRFPAIVCLFDSIGYVGTNDGIARVLAGVRSALVPGGCFVFEFWHAPAMLRGHAPTRVRRYALPNGELLRISETRLEAAAQLAFVDYELIELRNDGTFQRLRETQTNRFFFLPEMTAYLNNAGLELIAAHAGFEVAARIDADTWHIVAVAQAT